MPKLKTLLLRTNLLLLLFISACGSYKIPADYQKVSINKPIFVGTYFSNPEVDYVYKTHITVYGKELSGIFIVKKINETSHRVVFTTEFGNKLLDFEISETNVTVNSIVDELNVKLLIKTLTNDFKLLLNQNYDFSEQLENKEFRVFKVKKDGYFDYFYTNKTDGKLAQIIQTSNSKEKISIIFTVENNIFAQHISVQHRGIPLQLEFQYINQ